MYLLCQLYINNHRRAYTARVTVVATCVCVCVCVFVVFWPHEHVDPKIYQRVHHNAEKLL